MKSATTYQLIETLNDPGDGSGVFISVNSTKTITIIDDGTVEVMNGKLCGSDNVNDSEQGTIDRVNNVLDLSSCSVNSPPRVTFKFEGDLFLVNLPCIEPCTLKFKKVN